MEGEILDKSNKSALAFANIILDGSSLGAASDSEGRFVIEKIKPGSDGLMYFPYLGNTLSPNWNSTASGMFFGIRPTTSKAHFIRSVIEGVAFDCNSNVKIAKELCEYREKRRLNRSYAKCDLKTVVALSSNGEKKYFNISDQSDLYVLAQKFNNQFKKTNNIASNNQNLKETDMVVEWVDISKNEKSKNFNWHALVKHPKTNNHFT